MGAIADKIPFSYTKLAQALRAAMSTNVDIGDSLTGIPELQTLGTDLRAL